MTQSDISRFQHSRKSVAEITAEGDRGKEKANTLNEVFHLSTSLLTPLIVMLKKRMANSYPYTPLLCSRMFYNDEIMLW